MMRRQVRITRDAVRTVLGRALMGQVLHLPAARARALVEAGLAEYVRDEAQPEAQETPPAAAEPPPKAPVRRRRHKAVTAPKSRQAAAEAPGRADEPDSD